MKYALVTGASSGIGWFISRELAQRGYPIIAVSNQSERLDLLKDELEKAYSVSVVCLFMDLAREDAAREVYTYCKSNQYEIEVLVNNAGFLLAGEAVEVEYLKALAILQLHMTTPALLCQLFGKEMITRNTGYILNISSISAVMPYPLISFYGPSKTFLRYFTRAFRSEMKPYNIKVSCLIPGATATALYENQDVNVPLATKLGIMKKPEFIARAGVKALFAGRAERIPGIMNKLIVILFPLIPRFLISWANRARKS